MNFSNNVAVVVAMPGGTVMPKGTLGTGERQGMGKKQAFTECSATWKFVGPGYTMNKRTPDTVGDPTMCANQAGQNGPAVELLLDAQSGGVIHALGDLAEDEIEDRLEQTMAGPTNIAEEDDDDDDDEMEHTGVRDSKLVVEFLDPGPAGASILVRQIVEEDSSRENKTMLVDTGERSPNNELVQKLEERDVEEIDHLVLTHNHTDHIGGLLQTSSKPDNGLLGADIAIEKIYYNGINNDGADSQTDLRDELSGSNIDRERLTRDDGGKLAIGPEVDVDIYNPPDTPRSGCTETSDCNAIVMKISKGSNNFLLTSDIREDVEDELVDDFGEVDVLQLAHHGGANSNSEQLTNVGFDVSVFTGGDQNWASGTNVDFTPAYVTTNTDVKFVVTEDGELIGPRERVLTNDG